LLIYVDYQLSHGARRGLRLPEVDGDLRYLGETCGKHRIYRLMQAEGLKAQVG